MKLTSTLAMGITLLSTIHSTFALPQPIAEAEADAVASTTSSTSSTTCPYSLGSATKGRGKYHCNYNVFCSSNFQINLDGDSTPLGTEIVVSAKSRQECLNKCDNSDKCILASYFPTQAVESACYLFERPAGQPWVAVPIVSPGQNEGRDVMRVVKDSCRKTVAK